MATNVLTEEILDAAGVSALRRRVAELEAQVRRGDRRVRLESPDPRHCAQGSNGEPWMADPFA